GPRSCSLRRGFRHPAWAGRISPPAWGLLLGTPASTETGLEPAGAVQHERRPRPVFTGRARRSSGRTMPPSFSPDGSRLVDGTLLLDARTGSQIAQLDLLEPDHEIGHASPCHHVGTELIVCIQGGLALWATQTGESVPAGERLIVPRWERIAYSRCGRWLAFGHDQRVSIRALPSTAAVAEIAFDVPI